MNALARSAGGPQQQRSIQTRSRLVLAAATTFVEYGFASSTLSRIRANSGVTNGAFYHHFATREAVAEAVLGEYAARASNAVAEATRSAASGIDALLKVSVAFAKLLQSDVVVLAGVIVTSEIGSSFLSHGSYLDWLARIRPVIRICQREGSIRGDFSADHVSSLFVSSFTGTQLLSGALTDRQDLVERIGVHWRMILLGLTTPESAERVEKLVDSAFGDYQTTRVSEMTDDALSTSRTEEAQHALR
ncbi:TetR/AcrR family transcriptional regulator [Pseudoclavibacter sp. AY1H1]|uniref:TetR/AcrR family transcriptional regulator n=1 Tax=Pseudoclavibacter sp. AY1H1 TaxID=2080584 RepID=UPI000CE8F408|nr:TetR/AcrR family transcriptional regulator [Pseudoclavibacter sp. AY1H1]PPF40329.1 hypothetical protein C5E05_03850 [Pseudoclavibacter sp. AY1H1]